MSKNTRNTAFRKVDVDQFEEEKYEEEVVTDEGATGPNDAEVQSLLSKYPLIANKMPRSRARGAKRRSTSSYVALRLLGFKTLQ